MARFLFATVITTWLATSASAQTKTEEPGFVPIFDGKTLQGWEGNQKMFRVEKGAIVGGTLKERIAHNDFLCTEKKYGDFELRLEARLEGQGDNAGIQFRSERIPDHHEVKGYQCDMGTAWNRPVWGSLYDESRRRKMLVDADQQKVEKALRRNDWNEFRIRCEGPRVRIWLNGTLTVDYSEPDENISREGIIGLQIHGGKPAVASYRNIRIKTL